LSVHAADPTVPDADPDGAPASAPAPVALAGPEGAPADPLLPYLEALFTEALEELRYPELRKGVQALSELYVHSRAKGPIATRAADGRGKAAAFRCFYAPLHLIVTRALVRSLPPGPAPRQLVDLGCGSGAAGAGLALALAERGAPVELLGLDRVADHLRHARLGWAALGLRGKVKSGALPGALGAPIADAMLVFGWSLNELEPAARAETLLAVQRWLRRGAGLLILEPLSLKVSPWWPELRAQLAESGVQEVVFKERLPLPQRLRDLDRAAGLDHQELGCRALWRWPTGA
jgi:SAM-dependent methyltransferase